MTSDEAFRLGFFAKCAEAGMTPAEVDGHVKKANPALLAALGLGSGIAGITGYPIGALAGLAAVAPPVAGYLAGKEVAKATDLNETPEDMRKRELISEYRRLANRIRKEREAKKMIGES